MQTLSNGYLLPESGDRGNIFFPGLESNIQRINDHDHNGTNSEKLTSLSLLGLVDTTSLVSGNWSLQANGLYRALVTMPGTKLFDTTTIAIRLNNKPLFADYEKVTDNTFYVYVNDNSISATVLYL